MTVLDILNREDIHPILSQVDQQTRVFSSAMMMYISLKFLVFLVLNMVLMISIFSCIWDSLNENKRRKMKSDRIYILRNSLIIDEE